MGGKLLVQIGLGNGYRPSAMWREDSGFLRALDTLIQPRWQGLHLTPKSSSFWAKATALAMARAPGSPLHTYPV